jgi:PilZ domain
MRQNASKTVDPDQDARRSPRQRVSWLVTVATGSRQFQGRTKDISASGAKILLKERPPLGAEVALSFRPPGRRPVETRALVWRLDAEGLACMFVGTQAPEFLAAVTPRVAPPPRVTPPSRVAPAPRVAPDPPRISKPGPAGSVLLATVDTGFRALAVDTLGRSGYTVLDAGSQPLLALRMAEEHQDAITLILIAADLRLMNGEPLAQRIVSLLPSAKLVLMSSCSTPDPADPGALWLPTPCTEGQLAEQIRQAQAGGR